MTEFNWDFVITGSVIIGLILVIWAKISHQTIKETITDIIELTKGGGEEVEERAEEIIIDE